MNYNTALLKNKVELALLWPLISVGKILGYLIPLKTKHTIFLFFPNADVGGSIKVNADILDIIQHKKPVVIFSKKPKNNQFKKLFEIDGVRVIDLSAWIDNKWLHFINMIYRGIIAEWINKAPNPILFGGECIYFYKILPHVKKCTKKIELCHVNSWINYTQAYIRFIDYRIFSTKKIKRDVESQYINNSVPKKYVNHLHFIDNKINIPEYKRIQNNGLKILFVGRGAPQKRVHIVGAIAKKLEQYNNAYHFTFVGDVHKIIDEKQTNNCTLLGNINDNEKMNALYNNADVLILTSAYEGLPLVVMDMMARGKVVLSTAVDSIPDYITHLQNGLLLYKQHETEIVDEAVTLLILLQNDKILLQKLGQNAYKFALNHFSAKTFDAFYKPLFEV